MQDIETLNQEFTKAEKLSLLNKIEALKEEVSNADLKKSGKNTYQHYSYFELKDFMPLVRKLTRKYKIATQFNVIQGKAYLSVFDLETGCIRRWSHQLPEVDTISVDKNGRETIVKSTEQEKVKGALETYGRRYLYLAFLELTDGDPIDAGDVNPPAKKDKQKKGKKNYASPKTLLNQMREELGDAYNSENALKLLDKYVQDDITTPAIKKLVIPLIDKE